MSARAWLLAISALAAGMAGFLGSGCGYCTFTGEIQAGEPIDLGVDADLHAIVQLSDEIPNGYYEYLAVGEAGTIVAWGETYSRNKTKQFVEVSQFGDEDLHAAWVDRPGDDYDWYNPSKSWWVVGDAGTIAISDNKGATWNAIVLPGVDADLYGIDGFDGRPVIVGDEIVLVRLPDGTWTQPPTPEGGWGSLRSVASDGERIYAVGLEGKAWSTDHPNGEWVAEPVGVDVDLFDIDIQGSAFSLSYGPDELMIVGEAGTMLIQDRFGWEQYDGDLSVDLIDVHGNCMLGADGEVYEYGTLLPLDSSPGAMAVNCRYDIATVGADGLATMPPPSDC
jgi:hypothetical protein